MGRTTGKSTSGTRGSRRTRYVQPQIGTYFVCRTRSKKKISIFLLYIPYVIMSGKIAFFILYKIIYKILYIIY